MGRHRSVLDWVAVKVPTFDGHLNESRTRVALRLFAARLANYLIRKRFWVGLRPPATTALKINGLRFLRRPLVI